MGKKKTMEEIKAALSQNIADRAEMAKDRELGKAVMRVAINEISGEEVKSERTGKDYVRVSVIYRDLRRDELKEKRTPLFTNEAEFIVNELEPGNEYDINIRKVDGYWRWMSIVGQETAEEILMDKEAEEAPKEEK